MDLFADIRAELPNFTRSERLIADYILEYPFDAVRFGSSVLADYAHTSRSNVVRFCQKLGFSGYSEFRYELGRCLKENPHTQTSTASANNDTNVLQKYTNCFSLLNGLYQSTLLLEVAALLRAARRILVLGHHHSFLSAQQLAFRLNRAHYDAYALGDVSIIGEYETISSPKDVVVVFSIQGRKESYEENLKGYRDHGVKIVLVTVTPNAPISPLADYVIALPCITRQYQNEMLDDAPTFYLFIELLLEAMNSIKKGDEPTR